MHSPKETPDDHQQTTTTELRQIIPARRHILAAFPIPGGGHSKAASLRSNASAAFVFTTFPLALLIVRLLLPTFQATIATPA